MSGADCHGPLPASPEGLDNSSQPLRSWRLAVVIGSLCLGILLFGLDINILNVAIPQITTDFASLDTVSWYGSAYLLTVTAFQPGFGTLYSYFNPKITYLSSLIIFEGEIDLLVHNLFPHLSIVWLKHHEQQLALPFVLLRHHQMFSFSGEPSLELGQPVCFKVH